MIFVYSYSSKASFESGVAKYRKNNFPGALEEFTRLAEENDVKAQTALAMMYKYGEGTPADKEKAFKWYLKAAELGYPPAQYNAGTMLINGDGIEKNPERGERFLASAAESGFSRAIKKLENMVIEQKPLASSHQWSRPWDLTLPNQIRFSDNLTENFSEEKIKIQLAAMGSKKSAEKLWEVIKSKNDILLSGLTPTFEKIEGAGKLLWRLRVGYFRTEEQASSLCSQYLARNDEAIGCMIIAD